MSGSNMLPSLYQEFIHKSRYARWLWEENRRENWDETVARYFNFFDEHVKEMTGYTITAEERKQLEEAVLNLDIMPSMRCLMTAGEALKRENVSGYNCSYVAVDSPRSFDEILYVLMNGTGVGFSVESKYVDQLPVIPDELYPTDTTILVADSKLGWAKALKELIHLLYAGQIPKWDLSKVRPAGAPLKVFGGRASGPAPLNDLFNFAVASFKKAAGRRLNTLECHDIVCKIAEIVVVGGVRRSALISLSDLSDDRMRHAKSGDWWKENVQRALANNSYVGKEKPEPGIFMREWLSLYESRSGERGIFSRTASKKQAEKYGRRNPDHDFGTNPCSEIILRSREFCNLTEVVVRGDDTPETLKRKVKLATILGTFQSTLTNFKYLSKKWRENCEEERLLGVSLTGIMDNEYTNGRATQATGLFNIGDMLEELRNEAVRTNKTWAAKLGISVSAAITCVKPSGTVSQLVDSASGIHARHSPYYIRTVRADKKDPLAVMMKEMGFPVEDDVTKPDHTYVFSFPQKSPEHAVFRKDMSAIEQLELWLTYQRHWCEHKPSITVSVKEEEWMDVGAWCYKHFNELSGVSFLPFSDHTYAQAPYQDCTKEEYEALAAKMPKIVNWMDLAKYEKQDTTTGTQELACVAGGCEI
jgi:ribonucleoside-diphosphate reductase alpha chain